MHYDRSYAGVPGCQKTFSKAGASCIALGSALMRSLLGMLRYKAEEILAFGQFNNLEKAIPVNSLNSLLR